MGTIYRYTNRSLRKARMYSYFLFSSNTQHPLGSNLQLTSRSTFNSACSRKRRGSNSMPGLSHIFLQSLDEYKDDQSVVCVSIIYIIREQMMMLRKIVRPMVMRGGLVRNMMAGCPYGNNKVKPYDWKEKQRQPSPKKMKSMAVYEDQSQLELAQSIKQLSLKDFSIKVHQLLVGKQKSPIFWATVQQQFMERLLPTTNPHQIRSYSKALYALSKSKKAIGNYETKLSLILPFATPQSFTTIATAVSRIAPYSQQFGYIIEMLYYKRKSELNPREIIAVNYSLANNGRQCDKAIIEHLDSYNAVETITMLRCYDKGDQMTKEILGKTLKKLLAIRNEFNVLDISDIICIYLKHQYIPPVLQSMVEESYSILKRYINDICIQKIWSHLPSSLNKGYLKVKFVEEIITTIEILRKGKNMSEVIWKKIQPTFQQIENIELRLRLEKIY